MRTLTEEERSALHEVGPPDEVLPDSVFDECARLGWGFWDADGCWRVTESGKTTLYLDELARR